MSLYVQEQSLHLPTPELPLRRPKSWSRKIIMEGYPVYCQRIGGIVAPFVHRIDLPSENRVVGSMPFNFGYRNFGATWDLAALSKQLAGILPEILVGPEGGGGIIDPEPESAHSPYHILRISADVQREVGGHPADSFTNRKELGPIVGLFEPVERVREVPGIPQQAERVNIPRGWIGGRGSLPC